MRIGFMVLLALSGVFPSMALAQEGEPAAAEGADRSKDTGLLAAVNDFLDRSLVAPEKSWEQWQFLVNRTAEEVVTGSAAFSWTRSRKSEEEFRADGGVLAIYRPLPWKDGDIRGSFQAHATSASDGRRSNSYKGTMGFQRVFHVAEGPSEKLLADAQKAGKSRYETVMSGTRLTAFPVQLGGAWEWDRVEKVSKAGAQGSVTTNWAEIGMGKKQALTENRKSVSFEWKPVAGFEGGWTLRDGKGAAEEGNEQYWRWTGKLSAKITLDFITSRLSLVYDHSYWHRTTESPHSQNLQVASLEYKFVESNVSLGVSYTAGERAPAFVKERQFQVELGIQF